MKLGVVSAKRQTAMVMHVDYQVRLPSHDYVVASKHYFTLSVYSFLTILPSNIGQKNAVTYAGPTGFSFVAVNMIKRMHVHTVLILQH